jgi:putative membrane protein
VTIWVDVNGWPIPPIVLLGCIVAEILYFRGWSLLLIGAQAKQAARTMTPSVFAGSVGGEYQWNSWFWRGTFFLGAIFAFLVASSAPIDILSSRLLWVHMIQHLLLLVVVAPLLVASAPLLPLWLGLPRWGRRLIKGSVKLKARRTFYRMGERLLTQPVIACVLLIVGTWIWHWPPLYDLALTNNAIHDWCEHTTFLAVSILFWAQVIPSAPLHPRLGYPGRMGCVGIAIVQNIVLAVLIAFAQAPLYAPYAHLVTAPGGLTALQDQQLGAGIMWTFGDLPFGIAFSILVHRWLGSQSDDANSALQSLHPTEKVHAGNS